MAARPIRSILAASDLGASSDEVVRAAAALAERMGAAVHLVNALEIDRLPQMERPSYPDRTRQAERLLAEQAGRVAPSLRPESLVVLDYAAHKAVEARAADVRADLVVMGPHRGSETGARFLGTTVDRVIRTVEVPTLVVRAPLALPVRRIGVPTDLSAASAGALDVALALAGPLGPGGDGPEIRLFHVAWEIERRDAPAVVDERLGPALVRQAEEAAARAGDPPFLIRTEVAWGVSPADSIADHARKEGLELLVIGTHGQGGLRRFLIGSVASGVARQVQRPVLLVPPSFGQE